MMNRYEPFEMLRRNKLFGWKTYQYQIQNQFLSEYEKGAYNEASTPDQIHDLRGCQASNGVGLTGKDNSFLLHLSNGITLIFCAQDETEQTQWLHLFPQPQQQQQEQEEEEVETEKGSPSRVRKSHSQQAGMSDSAAFNMQARQRTNRSSSYELGCLPLLTKNLSTSENDLSRIPLSPLTADAKSMKGSLSLELGSADKQVESMGDSLVIAKMRRNSPEFRRMMDERRRNIGEHPFKNVLNKASLQNQDIQEESEPDHSKVLSSSIEPPKENSRLREEVA